MQFLVTGGSGFIATPIVQDLLDNGHEVKVLDLQKPIIEHKNLTFVQKSIMDEIEGDIKGCDGVYHFAALLGVDNSDKKPLQTMNINLEGTVHVFKSAMQAGVKNILFTSSSEVYGNPRELPIRESSVKGPVSAYGVSKLASEIYAQAFNKEFGTNIKIVRFFNVYGPRQPGNFVVSIFIDKALAGEPITVFGDGSQTRCYTYVNDVVRGVEAVVQKGIAGEAYNIGNTHPTTVLQLAELVKEVTGSSSEIKILGYGENTRLKEREIDYRIPDVSKIKAIGWESTTRIKQGIENILAWRKEHA